MQGEISILWVDTTRWKREILVYDKKSCVITARSCCRYSQFKAIPLTHGEEIDFMGQKFILYTYTALVYMEINTA